MHSQRFVANASPRHLLPIILVQSLRPLPPGNVDVKELPILRWSSLLHHIQDRLGPFVRGEVGIGAPQVGLEPLLGQRD